MAGINWTSENQTWDLTEELLKQAELDGDLETARKKSLISKSLLPYKIKESHERERLTRQDAIRKEIASRKEKMEKERAKSQGIDPGLENLSEVRPIDGKPTNRMGSIVNPQLGTSRTGPGGPLTTSKIGSEMAFPDEIRTTTETIKSGDLGQRGALLRQGPVRQTQTSVEPNVLRAGDVLNARMREKEFERSHQLAKDEFEFRKQIDTRVANAKESAARSEELFNLTRTSLAEEASNTERMNRELAFSEQINYDYPKLDAGRKRAIINAFKNGDSTTIDELLADQPESLTAKTKMHLSTLQIEKELAEIDKIKSEATKAKAEARRADPSLMLINHWNDKGLNHVTAVGLHPRMLVEADDPRLTEQLLESGQSLTAQAFKDGEFNESYTGQLNALQDQWWARGHIFAVQSGDDPARLAKLDIEPVVDNLMILIASGDKNAKVSVTPEQVAEATQFLVQSGLVDDDLQATAGNERVLEMANKYAGLQYEVRNAHQEVYQTTSPLPGPKHISSSRLNKDGKPLTAEEEYKESTTLERRINKELLLGRITGNLSNESRTKLLGERQRILSERPKLLERLGKEKRIQFENDQRYSQDITNARISDILNRSK